MKILSSPSSFGQISSKPFEILVENNFEYINNPFGRKLTEDEVINLATECIGIIAGVEPLNKRVIDHLPNLKCISRVGVGMDSVDVKYAESKGIKVINTPNGPTRAVAELTIGLTYSLLRKIPIAHHNLKAKIWKKETGNLLYGKKVGVIGLGRIGKMVSELFLKLGNKVFGYDLYPDVEWSKRNGVTIGSIDEVLGSSDIITLHVPLNKDKSCLLDKKLLNNLKKSSFLINVSRGGVVDENALYNILHEKKIMGAAIDVFNNEPYDGKFINLDNVILTPHLGSYAMEGKLQMEIDAVNNLINILKR